VDRARVGHAQQVGALRAVERAAQRDLSPQAVHLGTFVALDVHLARFQRILLALRVELQRQQRAGGQRGVEQFVRRGIVAGAARGRGEVGAPARGAGGEFDGGGAGQGTGGDGADRFGHRAALCAFALPTPGALRLFLVPRHGVGMGCHLRAGALSCAHQGAMKELT
jgi:hypothetical protein